VEMHTRPSEDGLWKRCGSLEPLPPSSIRRRQLRPGICQGAHRSLIDRPAAITSWLTARKTGKSVSIRNRADQLSPTLANPPIRLIGGRPSVATAADYRAGLPSNGADRRVAVARP